MDYVSKMEAREVKPQIRERRLRQPNWTEAEKELLITLTKNYRATLENKSSDSSALKKKAQAWDLISMQMHGAGYNRTKERLKQQLGRMRAASAKKARETLTQRPQSQSNAHEQSSTAQCGPATSSGYSSINSNRNRSYYNNKNNNNSNNYLKRCGYSMYNGIPMTPECQQNDYKIKLEQVSSYNMCNDITESKPNIRPITITLTDNDDDDENGDDVNDELDDISENAVQMPSTSTTTLSMRTPINQRLANGRRQQQLQRQFHMYRIAVERERLKSLRLQQRRDRQLYLKDLQIQNLKVQILRNLIQQNHSNPINF